MDLDGVEGGSAALCVEGERAPKVEWSQGVADAIVEGMRAGKVLREVCAAPGMPCERAVVRWAAEWPEFAARLRVARKAGGLRLTGGARSTYCEAVAEAICARLCCGEAMVTILRDVSMPGYSTVFKWLNDVPAFKEAVVLARDIQGLRLAELGWEAACGVTPETAFATRVKLEHLRWYAGKLSPRKYGPVTPAPPELPQEERLMTVVVRRFTDAPMAELGGLVLQPGEERMLSRSRLDADGTVIERQDMEDLPMEAREAWSRRPAAADPDLD
jgi:hypothetical protein